MKKVTRSDLSSNNVKCDDCGKYIFWNAEYGYLKSPVEENGRETIPAKKICKKCFDKLSKSEKELYSPFPRVGKPEEFKE